MLHCEILMSEAEKDLWFLFRMKYFQNSGCQVVKIYLFLVVSQIKFSRISSYTIITTVFALYIPMVLWGLTINYTVIIEQLGYCLTLS